MSSAESTTVEVELAPIPLSTVFCADDADVIIRTAESHEFRVHKPILSLVSPIFRDMFTLPQPQSTDTPDILPHFDVDESAETWENIFRTIYPMPNPVVDNIDDLESLLLTAMKYEIQSVIDIHKTSLERRAFIREDPLRLYAIACSCGLDEQAKYVTRNAELLTVTGHADAGDLRGLTVASYHNLISSLAQRDNQWHQVLGLVWVPDGSRCSCYQASINTFYDNIKENLEVAHVSTEEVYLKALEDRLRSRQPGCRMKNCSVGDSEIKAFIERAMRERERLFDGIVPGPLAPNLLVPCPTFPDQLNSTVHSPDSTVYSPDLTVHIPDSMVHNPDLMVHSPDSTVLSASTICDFVATFFYIVTHLLLFSFIAILVYRVVYMVISGLF